MTQAGWDDFGGRFVVLITDAGPNPAQESTIAERADAATLSALAREQGIAIYTMHLRTAAGAGTHDFAEGQYRELSRALGSDAGDRYHPIEGGSPEALGENVAQLASSMVESVRQAMDGRVAEALEAAEGELAETAALDTLAMQLAYLGRLQDERAPDVFKAWIADRALENTTQTAVEVRLLITKNQLNTLRDVLREIVDAGEATRTDSAAFFDQVRGALAAMARGDEERLVNAQFDTLGGALGEFLDGLPYRSPLLGADARALAQHLERRAARDPRSPAQPAAPVRAGARRSGQLDGAVRRRAARRDGLRHAAGVLALGRTRPCPCASCWSRCASGAPPTIACSS